MLVLTRKKKEVIRVGDDVKIVVVEIRGDKVRIGIDAPKEIGVHREEVYQSIRGDQGPDKPIRSLHKETPGDNKETPGNSP